MSIGLLLHTYQYLFAVQCHGCVTSPGGLFRLCTFLSSAFFRPVFLKPIYTLGTWVPARLIVANQFCTNKLPRVWTIFASGR